MAAAYGVGVTGEVAVVIDIGGGSVEITRGLGAAAESARSFKLGVIRLTERFVREDPPSAEELEAMRLAVEDLLEDAEGQVPVGEVAAEPGGHRPVQVVDLHRPGHRLGPGGPLGGRAEVSDLHRVVHRVVRVLQVFEQQLQRRRQGIVRLSRSTPRNGLGFANRSSEGIHRPTNR